MPKFSKKSKDFLYTCDDRIILVANNAIKHVDFRVLEGIRTLDQQKKYKKDGLSETLKSKHLPTKEFPKSRAIHLIPHPFKKKDWKNREKFALFAGFILGIADAYGVKMRWGGDWKQSGDPTENTFYDALHFELME